MIPQEREAYVRTRGLKACFAVVAPFNPPQTFIFRPIIANFR